MLNLLRTIICLFWISATAALAVDLPEAKATLTLGQVDGEANDNSSFVNIRFNRKPDFEKVTVSSHGSFIQIDLPGTLIPNPGAFVDGNSPYVKKIAIFQLTNTDGAVRLFVTKSAADIQKSMRAEVLGNRVLVTIDHKKMNEIAAATLTAATGESPTPEQAATAAVTTITPADVMHGKATAEQAGFATGGIDFREKLVKVAAFIGGLLFIATVLMMLRPIIRRRSRKKGKGANNEPAFGMSTIASMSLAPKQKLSLIQVGNEKILIAIGPESVTYIATIGAHTHPQMAMAQAMPQAFAWPTLPGAANFAHAAPVAQKQEGVPTTRETFPETQPSRLRMGEESSSNDRAFNNALQTANPDAKHIRLKADPAANIEPRATAPKAKVKPKQKTPEAQIKRSGGRVNIGISEDGVTDLNPRASQPEKSKSADPRTIDDVTQLIRQKLQAFKSL